MSNDDPGYLARTSGPTAYERNGGANRDVRRVVLRILGFVVLFIVLCLIFWAMSA